MTRVQQTQDALRKQLEEQLGFLDHNARQYDSGNVLFAKPMATILRVLLHDTDKSHSLLEQLELKSRFFYDTATASMLDDVPDGFDYTNQKYVGTFLGVIGMTHTAKLVPYLDSQDNREFFGFTSFDQYWNRVILLDVNEQAFTRRDIVLAIANTDGGSHVDPKLEKKYHELTRENSLGILGQESGKFRTTNYAALACIRQISHEILRTLQIQYPRKNQIVSSGQPVFTFRLVAKRGSPTNDPAPRMVYGRVQPQGINECPCRGGQKYKECHGKYFAIY